MTIQPYVKPQLGLLKPQFDVVGTAMDGATLVSEALRLLPDVIVTDITMPVLSGIDAAHQLRESASSAKIVFLTIHPEEQFMKACMAEGAFPRQRAVRTQVSITTRPWSKPDFL